MEAYLTAKEMVNIKMDSAYDALANQTNSFADQYEIQLVDDQSKRSKKLTNANRVTEYYDDVYLLFFKSFIQERYYLNALENGRIGDIEQTRQTLETIASEDLEKVTSFPDYEGDTELRKACQDLVKFYYAEAIKYGQQQVEFFMKKEKIDDLNKKLTPQNRKTRQSNKLMNTIRLFRNSMPPLIR